MRAFYSKVIIDLLLSAYLHARNCHPISRDYYLTLEMLRITKIQVMHALALYIHYVNVHTYENIFIDEYILICICY